MRVRNTSVKINTLNKKRERNASARENYPREKRRHAAGRDLFFFVVFLAWGDFHARSRFARSTIPEEKMGDYSLSNLVQRVSENQTPETHDFVRVGWWVVLQICAPEGKTVRKNE